jgi:hypothetical protein
VKGPVVYCEQRAVGCIEVGEDGSPFTYDLERLRLCGVFSLSLLKVSG